MIFDFGQNGTWDAAAATMGASARDVWGGAGIWCMEPLFLYTDQVAYEIDRAVADDQGAAAGFAYNTYGGAYAGRFHSRAFLRVRLPREVVTMVLRLGPALLSPWPN